MWPELWPVWQLFMCIRTQWRVGARGASGLDYCAAYPLIDRMCPNDPDAWMQTLHDLRDLEDAALAAIHEGADE